MFRTSFLEDCAYDSAYTLGGEVHGDVIDLVPDPEFGDIMEGVGQPDAAGRHMRLTLILSGEAIKATWAEFDSNGKYHMGGDAEFVEQAGALYGGWSMDGEDPASDCRGTWVLIPRGYQPQSGQ
jgi:hypothetical protein